MREYDILHWMLFFFIYSFIGWIWESGYVSAKERRPVNRGFMHGPFLPLYGSGAVVVLACTMGVRENIVLVFLMGMAGATVLEYITGAVMERLFHVKYWDYSNQKLNLNGYICLPASLCWGCFSVLMVEVFHPPVEEAVFMIPRTAAAVIVCVLTVGSAADFAAAFREALDMKELLGRVEKSKAQLRRLQDKLHEAAEAGLYAEKWKKDLAEIKENIRCELQAISQRSDRRHLRIARIIRRNPTAVSGKFKETMDELKKIINGRK